MPSCARMSACTVGVAVAVSAMTGARIGSAAQAGQILAQHAVVGPEVMAPLRDAMRLINGDQRQFALGQHLGKSGHAQPLRRDEEKLQIASQIVRAHLTGRAALQAGVNARHTQAKRGQLRRLIFHERDQGRDHQRRSAARDGGQLVAERLPRPGGHHQQQVAPLDRRAANLLLIGAKAGKAKDGLQEPEQRIRIGRGSSKRIRHPESQIASSIVHSDGRRRPSRIA